MSNKILPLPGKIGAIALLWRLKNLPICLSKSSLTNTTLHDKSVYFVMYLICRFDAPPTAHPGQLCPIPGHRGIVSKTHSLPSAKIGSKCLYSTIKSLSSRGSKTFDVDTGGTSYPSAFELSCSLAETPKRPHRPDFLCQPCMTFEVSINWQPCAQFTL